MRRRVVLGAAVAIAVPGILGVPAEGRAPARVVAAGHDLFQTDSGGTHYGPVHFTGVAGCRAFPQAPHTDTVVQRKQTASPARPSIDIEARCLQLQGAFVDPKGASPVFDSLANGMVQVGSVSLPVRAVFVTLQSDRGRHPTDAQWEVRQPARASTGKIHFKFDGSGCGGTFDSDLKVYFDVRAGSIDGPIVYAADETVAPFFHSYATPWGCRADRNQGGFKDEAQTLCLPPINSRDTCIASDEHQVGAPSDLVPGMNYRMNGRDGSQDFFPMQPPA